uniref:Tafazzin family protein n=1 Tax=Hirondellea gigas TaxID=1518452 RepID=A0A2P2ICA8_9CRUS
MPPEFRLKFAWPLPDMKDGVPWTYVVRSSLIVPIVGTLSKMWLCWLNKTRIHNGETYDYWVNSRPSDQPLITVSNHYSCLDDPLIYGTLPWHSLLSYSRMRWSLAAHDIVFTRRITSWFFASGKCVPVVRGIGVHQRAIDFCTNRLREGSWVHVFPEGKVNDKHNELRLKWGVGRMIYDCWALHRKPFENPSTSNGGTSASTSISDKLRGTSPSDDTTVLVVSSNANTTNTRNHNHEINGVSVVSNSLEKEESDGATRNCGSAFNAALRRRVLENSVNDSDCRLGRVSANSGSNDCNGALNNDADDVILNGRSSRCSRNNNREEDSRDVRNCRENMEWDSALPGKVPVILPLYHVGMDSVLPNVYPYRPKIGQKVTILVGEPLDMKPILARIDHQNKDPVEARKIITDCIQVELRKLRSRAEELHRAYLNS